MSRGLAPGLVLVTDRRIAVRPLEVLVADALAAGFVAVMLREKDLGGAELLALAASLLPACREAERPLVINERLDVAMALPPAGAHLGIRSLPLASARGLLGGDRLLGYSAHEIPEAAAALRAGADYVTLSPVFPPGSKPGLPARGIGFLAEALRTLPADRVVALGGMDTSTLPAARRAGARGAAVCGAAMSAASIAELRALVAAWNQAAA